jgi:hypothetical protein
MATLPLWMMRGIYSCSQFMQGREANFAVANKMAALFDARIGMKYPVGDFPVGYAQTKRESNRSDQSIRRWFR